MPDKSLPGEKAAQAVRSCKGEGRCFRGADNSVISRDDFRAGRPAPAPPRAPASIHRRPSHFLADAEPCQAAEAGRAAAAASSSNAALISRMLMTPARL
jgi:hypothetical protein